MDHGSMYSVTPQLRWRDLIELNIHNANLKRRVETFLDVFEQSAFRYDFMDAATGQVEDRYLSGQDILARLAQVKDDTKAWLQERQGSKIHDFFASTSVIKSGKYTISQHDRPFGNSIANGTQSMFVGNPTSGAYPIGFEIGADYLKGAKYHGVDGQTHPVTVDAAVAHELAHIAYNTSDEEIPITVESIVTSALGAVQRKNVHDIVYKKDSNGGFLSLAHKAKSDGALTEEFASRVRSDFASKAPGGYDFSQAMAMMDISATIK